MTSAETRARRWTVLDTTIARLDPGKYPIKQLTAEFNKDLNAGHGHGKVCNNTTGLLLRGKDTVRFVGRIHCEGIWEILPREGVEA